MAGKHVGAWQNSSDPLPGFQWNERTTKAYAEGRYQSALNYHVVGTDAHRAYVAGAVGRNDPTQAFESGRGTGEDPYAPIVGGFNFTGAVGDGATAIASVDPELPIYFSCKFRADQNDKAMALLNHEANQFRVRCKGNGKMEAQGPGGTVEYDLLAYVPATDYFLVFEQALDGAGTMTLNNITDQTTVSQTQQLWIGTRIADPPGVGSLFDQSGANFNGIISEMRFGVGGVALSHWWKFDDGSGLTVTDYVAGNDLTIAANSGSWV